jgi:beta-lactamase regulating signal transducer with metallopeptidase domain
MFDDIVGEFRTPRRIELILHENLSGPMTFGFIRPAIVFPPDAPTWSRDDLRRAITHELEHVRRGDWVVFCMARSVCALYWFHPLVWMAWRQLRLEPNARAMTPSWGSPNRRCTPINW